MAVVCLAEILSMTPFSMFLALQPQLQDGWDLSNTASGWISSAYFTGYMLAVPVLGSLTDRIDARTVWLGACALAGVGSLGFAVLADGVWTAVLLQLVTGAGLAGTYMPGLKVITDRLAELPRPRHVAFYTTSFTIGSSLSFWIIGRWMRAFSWRTAVALVSARARWPAACSSGCCCGLSRWRRTRTPTGRARARGAPLRLIRCATSIGYAAHVWELFALRAWVVPFVVFCQGWRGTASPLPVATLAAIVSLVGVPSSLAGAELTTRAPRRRIIITVMLTSIVVSLLVVPAAFGSWWLLIVAVCGYNAFISADSAALTSGIVAVAPPASRGTAMAIYSTLGFAAASAGTFAVGLTLDLLGGQSVMSWTVAFAIMSAAEPRRCAGIARDAARRRGCACDHRRRTRRASSSVVFQPDTEIRSAGSPRHGSARPSRCDPAGSLRDQLAVTFSPDGGRGIAPAPGSARRRSGPRCLARRAQRVGDDAGAGAAAIDHLLDAAAVRATGSRRRPALPRARRDASGVQSCPSRSSSPPRSRYSAVWLMAARCAAGCATITKPESYGTLSHLCPSTVHESAAATPRRWCAERLRHRGPQAEGAVHVQPRPARVDERLDLVDRIEGAGVHIPGLGAHDGRSRRRRQRALESRGDHPALVIAVDVDDRRRDRDR